MKHYVKGTITGPGTIPNNVVVQFESPGGRWNRSPTEISRTKMATEDIVCSFFIESFL